MIQRLIELDHQVFLYLNNLGTETWDWFWLILSDKWAAIPLYALLVFLLFKKLGWKTTAIGLVFVTLLITSTDQLANVFKDGFQRVRPCEEEGVMEYARLVAGHCGGYGYFSAHASNSFGVAIFLGLLFKKYYQKMIWFLLAWAVLVAYSRVYLGVHYPGDIITGALIGSVFGYIYARLFLLLKSKFL